MEWRDSSPAVDVGDERYARLVGYPAGHGFTERSGELAAWAREWYGRNGRPWIYARQAERIAAAGGAVEIDGVRFGSTRMVRAFERAGATAAVLAAVGAGPELEAEAQRLWREEKPDEYFFLEVFGSAVVERLIEAAGARLCAWADGDGLAVLPHSSPGYDGWDVAEQGRLLALIGAGLPVEALESGALRPVKSQLAVFGIAPASDRVRRLTELVPCYSCSLAQCEFRRGPKR